MKKLYTRFVRGVRTIQKKGTKVGKTLLRRSLTQNAAHSKNIFSKKKIPLKRIPNKLNKKNKPRIHKKTISKIHKERTSVAQRLQSKSEKSYVKKAGYEISQEQFSLISLHILNQDGSTVGKMPALTPDQIKEMYRFMILSRAFDDAALKLQRQGRLGTYASVRGQEASQVGSAYALQKEDWLVPTFRENASCITRGMPMKCLFQYWGGDERGHSYTESMTTLPLSIPISTQLLHGVGIAMAIQYKAEKKVVLAHMGDGGTSEGDFHEALNFAGVFKAPIVFLCQNNQWAISMPRKKQTASTTIAQKAIAYGFSGIQVDGNDLFAVYSALSTAYEKARSGGGPTLIECVTYRISDHTTADDAKRYRSQEEVDAWTKKDPIDCVKNYMLRQKVWDAKKEELLQQQTTALVSAHVKAYEDEPVADPKEIFTSTFAAMTPQLQEQYESLLEIIGKKKDPTLLEKVEGGFP